MPQAILSLARLLALNNVATDVLASGRLAVDVGRQAFLERAPRAITGANVNMDAYGALLVAGPWQRAAGRLVIQSCRAGVRTVYAPKGGLALAEYSRLRDIRKILYLVASERRVLTMSDNILFSSIAERRATPIPTGGRSIILPEPFELNAELNDVGRGGSTSVTLGAIGQLSPRKGIRELIEAVGVLRTQDTFRGKLVIAGGVRRGYEAYARRVRALADRIGGIEWLGEIGHERRQQFYGSLDAVVVPSRFESFGFVVLEALANRRPVICGPNIGALEYIPTSQVVTVASDLTPAHLAAAISDVVGSLKCLRGTAGDLHEMLRVRFWGSDLAAEYEKVLFG